LGVSLIKSQVDGHGYQLQGNFVVGVFEDHGHDGCDAVGVREHGLDSVVHTEMVDDAEDDAFHFWVV
jgi:hypothetical protein